MADRDELKESEYDGIQEYDNDLPRWWVHLFWLTIVWGVGYEYGFTILRRRLPESDWRHKWQRLKRFKRKLIAK